MAVLGLWLAILGYAMAYSGVVQLQGGQCSLPDAFRGRCRPKQSQPAGRTGAQVDQSASLSKQPLSQTPEGERVA